MCIAQLYSLPETPQPTLPPAFGLIGQPKIDDISLWAPRSNKDEPQLDKFKL